MSPQEHARARLAERARAVARIRRGVLVAVLAAFVLAWGVIAATGSMGDATRRDADRRDDRPARPRRRRPTGPATTTTRAARVTTAQS